MVLLLMVMSTITITITINKALIIYVIVHVEDPRG